MTCKIKWMRGQNPKRKIHLCYYHEWHQNAICGSSGLGTLKAVKIVDLTESNACKTCLHIAVLHDYKITV
jgi:hypothetical protein